MKHYDEAIAEFIASKPFTVDLSLPDGIKTVLRSLDTPANLPFSRELWAYSLVDSVAKVNEPLLVVIGKKDIQVDWEANGKALEKAVAQNPGASFVYPENANHVLKHEETPKEELTGQNAILNYNAQNAVLDEEAVNVIIDWLKKFSDNER